MDDTRALMQGALWDNVTPVACSPQLIHQAAEPRFISLSRLNNPKGYANLKNCEPRNDEPTAAPVISIGRDQSRRQHSAVAYSPPFLHNPPKGFKGCADLSRSGLYHGDSTNTLLPLQWIKVRQVGRRSFPPNVDKEQQRKVDQD